MDNALDKSYLFIGGTGRSGTNICRKILSLHSSVASLPFEHRFTIDPGGVLDFYSTYSHSWSPFITDIKLKRLEQFLLNLASKKTDKANYQGWELDQWLPSFSDHAKTLLKQLQDFSYAGFWPGAVGTEGDYDISYASPRTKQQLQKPFSDFLIKCFDSLLDSQQKTVYVEDNTWNLLFCNEMTELLPQSRFLHLLRDPRDVVASFVKQRWCPADLEQAITMYHDLIERMMSNTSILPQSRLLTIKLEELVADSQSTINAICAFMGIADESALHSIALDKANTGRWLNEFSKQDQLLLERELEQWIVKLGYARD